MADRTASRLGKRGTLVRWGDFPNDDHGRKDFVMKLSVMLFAFYPEMEDAVRSPSSFLEKLKSAGVTGLEPARMWIEEHPRRWDEILRVATDLGFSLPCLDGFVDFVGRGRADRPAAVDATVRAVERCAAMRCPVMLVTGTQCAAGIRVVFDTGNFLFADSKPVDNLPLLQDRIVHVHVKDLAVAAAGQKVILNSKAGIPYADCALPFLMHRSGLGLGTIRLVLQGATPSHGFSKRPALVGAPYFLEKLPHRISRAWITEP